MSSFNTIKILQIIKYLSLVVYVFYEDIFVHQKFT